MVGNPFLVCEGVFFQEVEVRFLDENDVTVVLEMGDVFPHAIPT